MHELIMHGIKLVPMKANTTVKLETALLFAMGMVIFLSKPGIYLVCLLLLSVTALRLFTNIHYRQEVLSNKLFWVSTGLFVLGIAATAMGSNHPEDVGWMAKKTMLLPMTAPLLIAFANPTNRTAGLSGVVVGFWIAFVLTGNMHNWSWDGGRLEGARWLVDAWGVICAMLLVFLTPLAFDPSQKPTRRFILSSTIAAALIMLITTGARGPWLGAMCGIFIFLLVKHRRTLVILCFSGLVIGLAVTAIWPSQTEALKFRFTSIANIDDNSNNVRLALWETGGAIIHKKLIEGDKNLWTGMGHDGHIASSTNFYRDEFSSKATIGPGRLNETLINDFHNMYIQSIIQNGMFWTFGILAFLILICLKRRTPDNATRISWLCIPTLINFLTIGITYTILPHFAFIFLIYFLTLIHGYDN